MTASVEEFVERPAFALVKFAPYRFNNAVYSVERNAVEPVSLMST